MFGPGIALFADSGQAVERNLRLSGMKTDVGIGLRFGLARFESALLRFDIAYALNDGPLSHRGRVFSISTMQAF
jgi:outer membrane translocation and assembly module TamA